MTTQVSVPRQELAECIAADLLFDLSRFNEHLDKVIPNDMARFRLALAKYPEPFAVRYFEGADQEAAFKANNCTGQLEFNLHPINLVTRFIVSRTPNRHLRRDQITAVIEQFFLHESFHVGQNFIRHGDAQAIALAASPFEVATLDLMADTFAAKCAALLACLREGRPSTGNYRWHFLQQLMLMLEFWLPVVKSPPTKPHKQARFLGLALKAACLAEAVRENRFSDSVLPFDIPLLPRWDSSRSLIAIFALAPDVVIWAPPSSVNPAMLSDLLDKLDSQPVEETLMKARYLLRSLGMTPTELP